VILEACAGGALLRLDPAHVRVPDALGWGVCALDDHEIEAELLSVLNDLEALPARESPRARTPRAKEIALFDSAPIAREADRVRPAPLARGPRRGRSRGLRRVRAAPCV
jgi:hypothetical protein